MNLIQIWNHHNRKKCFILILKSCNNHNCLLYSNSLHHYHQKSFQILSFLFLSIHFTIITTTGKKWCNWVLYVVQAKKSYDWKFIHFLAWSHFLPLKYQWTDFWLDVLIRITPCCSLMMISVVIVVYDHDDDKRKKQKAKRTKFFPIFKVDEHILFRMWISFIFFLFGSFSCYCWCYCL